MHSTFTSELGADTSHFTIKVGDVSTSIQVQGRAVNGMVVGADGESMPLNHFVAPLDHSGSLTLHQYSK
jgi:hypothetical protein